MNLLFIVEGKRTEKKLYKKWVKYCHPNLSFVDSIDKVSGDNYVIISGKGYPNYLNVICNAFKDIQRLNNIDHIFICVDSEELSYVEKYDQIEQHINDVCGAIEIQPLIIIQNHCIETWLMGNKKLNISSCSNNLLRSYRNFYNVNIRDPEQMSSMDSELTIAQFSYNYFRLMVQQKGLIYTKTNIKHVGNKSYFNQLIKRCRTDSHICSFGYFINQLNRLT